MRTNLLGSLLATRTALKRFARQPRGGHVFLMEGAGSDGSASPRYSVYGATKAGIRQMSKSLQVGGTLWSR